jgi:hypothetical protein
MPYGSVNADLMTTSDGVSSSGLYGFKNRIINGAMVIDQRNAGASFTPTSGNYGLDRYRYFVSQASKITAQQSSTVPTGFSTSFLQTVASAVTPGSSDYFVFQQNIEGYNIADMQFGTASAATFTVSFWVRSSVTGTYSVYLANASVNRTYLANYTVIAANTWEQKTITITGDTTGTWGNTNGGGIMIGWDLGSGSTYNGTANAWQAGQYYRTSSSVNWISTAGATFYITGVQLEKGSTATSFDYRPYGTELQLCQRYFAKLTPYSANPYTTWGAGFLWATTSCNLYIKYPTTMRASPTLGYSGNIWVASASNYTISGVNNTYPGLDSTNWQPSGISGATIGHGCVLMSANDASAFVTLSSEL